MSTPISQEEAEETKRALKDRMMRQSQELFGDITVKATVILSQCVHFDDEFIINDIAVPNEEGLHFRDWRNILILRTLLSFKIYDNAISSSIKRLFYRFASYPIFNLW